VHEPDWQVSPVVQAFPSLHVVPFVAWPSAGHVVLLPVQTSATSQVPFLARQTAPAFPAGCWQAACVPSHWSSVQGFPSLVQPVPLGDFASFGQAAEKPLQVSAGSHSPVDARQTVPEAAKPSDGQLVEEPLHVSATSQPPFWARQTVPLDRGVQVPRCPARLQAPQVPVQALSQQMPLTQKPEAHWLLLLQLRPNEAS
jgi:hypothetical protein